MATERAQSLHVKILAPVFGSPPQTAREWMESFAESCDDSRRVSLNPIERIRLKARAKALRDAAQLVARGELVGR